MRVPRLLLGTPVEKPHSGSIHTLGEIDTVSARLAEGGVRVEEGGNLGGVGEAREEVGEGGGVFEADCRALDRASWLGLEK